MCTSLYISWTLIEQILHFVHVYTYVLVSICMRIFYQLFLHLHAHSDFGLLELPLRLLHSCSDRPCCKVALTAAAAAAAAELSWSESKCCCHCNKRDSAPVKTVL